MSRIPPGETQQCPPHQGDALTGALMAFEGIRGAVTLLHGPTGCKFYHGAVSAGQLPRLDDHDPLACEHDVYFGQPRVPCTYLGGDDYVHGAAQKIEDVLHRIGSSAPSLVGIVNSPGAALIGDDLDRIARAARIPCPVVTLESPGFSQPATAGFTKAVVKTLEHVAETQGDRAGRRICLTDTSLLHRNFRGDIEELRRLCALCGVEVTASICADVGIDELSKVGSNAASAGVIPQADGVGRWLEDNLAVERVPCDLAPIGFDAAEQWITSVCKAVGADPSPARSDIARARATAAVHISRIHSLSGLPTGARYSIRTDASVAAPLSRWLHEYLGMIPAAVKPTDPQSPAAAKLRDWLRDIGADSAADADVISTPAEVILADGVTLSRAGLSMPEVGTIELDLPTRVPVEILPRTFLGARGALQLLERLLTELVQSEAC